MVFICNLAIFSTSDERLVKSILNSKNKKAMVKIVITNLPNSPVIEAAKRCNAEYKCFDHREYPDRISHEKDIVRYLLHKKIGIIIFAHYMRLVTKYFINRFRGKIINVHPSLLPHFKGINPVKEAYEAGISESGCTLHYVNDGLDTGKIILQKEVPRLENDSFNSFRNRVHDAECESVRIVLESLVV